MLVGFIASAFAAPTLRAADEDDHLNSCRWHVESYECEAEPCTIRAECDEGMPITGSCFISTTVSPVLYVMRPYYDHNGNENGDYGTGNDPPYNGMVWHSAYDGPAGFYCGFKDVDEAGPFEDGDDVTATVLCCGE
jgi:hypothetical protein